MKILITGANGYIGNYLVEKTLHHGHEIIIASRNRDVYAQLPSIHFDLTSNHISELVYEIDAVVHLAAYTSQVKPQHSDLEIIAATKLIHAAKKIDAKFIFVSSQSARADAPSAYGKTKYQIEQVALSEGGWIVRPGLVYGGKNQGLFGILVNLVKKLSVLPAFFPAPNVQPIHVEDLASGLLELVERQDLPMGIYSLASPTPISFTEFLKEIASARLYCWRYFVVVPTCIIYWCIHVLGSKYSSRLGLDRLRALFELPIMNSSGDLILLGIKLRSLRSGMHRSGNNQRRELLRESGAIFLYLLNDSPDRNLIRRYVRVVERLRDGYPVGLPNIFVHFPKMISLMDYSSSNNNQFTQEFLWRLDAATLLAEASTQGASRFLNVGKNDSWLKSALLLGHLMASEVSWRIMQKITSKWVVKFFPFLSNKAER